MSAQVSAKRLSVTQIQRRKNGDKLVCLTAYTASVARHLDFAGADFTVVLAGGAFKACPSKRRAARILPGNPGGIRCSHALKR